MLKSHQSDTPVIIMFYICDKVVIYYAKGNIL